MLACKMVTFGEMKYVRYPLDFFDHEQYGNKETEPCANEDSEDDR